MSHASRTKARTRIVEVLGESVYHALGLMESLRDERTALEQQDSAALNDTLTIKSCCVGKLTELENQRAELCEASGFETGPFQMEAMTNWCDQDLVLRNCWDHLMEIAADCNALNFTNGAIIRGRQQHLESNLAVLRGSDQDLDTYQRTGSGNRSMIQRSLADA